MQSICNVHLILFLFGKAKYYGYAPFEKRSMPGLFIISSILIVTETGLVNQHQKNDLVASRRLHFYSLKLANTNKIITTMFCKSPFGLVAKTQ